MAAKAAGKAKADSDATGAAKKPARQKAAAKKATAKKATAKKTTSKKPARRTASAKLSAKPAKAPAPQPEPQAPVGPSAEQIAAWQALSTEARGALREREAARVFAEAAETHQQGDLVEGH